MPATVTLDGRRRRTRLLVLAASCLVFLCLGLVVGLLIRSGPEAPSADDQRLLAAAKKMLHDGFNDDVAAKLLRRLDVERIRQNLKLVTSVPHIAGTEGDHLLASRIGAAWNDSGLEDVQLPGYHVLLSYPDGPGTVALVSGGDPGEVHYQGGELSELDFLGDGDWRGSPYPFPYLAYSVNGTVTGEAVFGNYGSEGDLDELERRNVSVRGKIVVVKHGLMMAGRKVTEAEKRGAVGVLMYPDPSDPNATLPESVYPTRWGLPETGVLRAALRSRIGDPRTPAVPSKDYTYHVPHNETDLPNIPSHTISYKDAREILGRLGGPEAPEEWHGGLGIPYRLGPGFTDQLRDWKVKFTVGAQPKETVTYNVVGFLYGDVEPDRYVILGNHRDGWVRGATDPGSGTAVLLEVARVLGQFYKEGWRPRRTLVFCSWGAEEFGLIGSMEWMEEHVLKLQERTVAYINIDTCVTGDAFDPLMSLTLKEESIRVARMIPDPDGADDSGRTLYDSWYDKLKAVDRLDSRGKIPIQALDLYSDFGPFLYFAGIPILDVNWHYLKNVELSPYPSYHTEFESIDYVERFLDPGYRRHLGCARFTSMMLHSLAGSALLPFDFDEYIYDIVYVASLIESAEKILKIYNVSLDYLNGTLRLLDSSVEQWKAHVKQSDRNNPYVLRALNDHMMLIHKAFYNRISTGLPDAWLYRFGYEKTLYTIYDILSDRGTRDAHIETVKKLLSHLTLQMQQLHTLLVTKPFTL